MEKTENQKSKSKSLAVRVKPGTNLYQVYDTLSEGYETDSDLLKDALWALMEKKYPDRMKVQMIPVKVVLDD